jgi:DNA-binding transcriptional LysR family regulator
MSRRLDSTSARIFISIIEAGSLGRAAARENVVVSAISKRLSDLEDQLGVTLVERLPTGIRPTPAGEALAHHSRLILQALDRAHEEISEYANGVRGHIRVRVSPSSLVEGLAQKISDHLVLHPRIKIDLEEVPTPQIFGDVLEGRADLGVAPDILRPAEFQYVPYADYRLCIVVPQGHALASLRTVRYAEALTYDQVEQRNSSILTQLLDQAAKQSGLAKRTRIRVSSFESMCAMVGSGMGVGVVPSMFKAVQSRAHGVRFIPLSDPWADSKLVIVYRSLHSLPTAARSLLGHLAPQLGLER